MSEHLTREKIAIIKAEAEAEVRKCREHCQGFGTSWHYNAANSNVPALCNALLAAMDKCEEAERFCKCQDSECESLKARLHKAEANAAVMLRAIDAFLVWENKEDRQQGATAQEWNNQTEALAESVQADAGRKLLQEIDDLREYGQIQADTIFAMKREQLGKPIGGFVTLKAKPELPPFGPFDLMTIKRSVAILWDAVLRGVYDSRSIAGDETLHMKEVLFGSGYDELNAEIDRWKKSTKYREEHGTQEQEKKNEKQS